VRIAAAGGMESLPPERRVSVLAPMLDDPLAAVRIEAARVLAAVPREMFASASYERFQEVRAEYVDAQMAMGDMPAARLRLAVLHLQNNEAALAEREYLTAIRFDPRFLPARFNLATLYNQQGRNPEAELVLREGIERIPGEGELHYSLGLLLAEERRMEEAAESLGRAVALIPGRARMRYNYGLMLQQLRRLDEAETALLAAHELDTGDPDILLAVAQLYAGLGNWAEAERYASDLVELVPGAEGPQQLLDDIRRRGGG